MPLSAKIPVSGRGSQPIITADLTCLECELGVPLVTCMHSHKQQGERQFGNLHTRDIKAGAFNLFHEQSVETTTLYAAVENFSVAKVL